MNFRWTQLSSSNKIQRNYMRLKITACLQQLEHILGKRCKETKTPVLKSLEQRPGTACAQACNSPKGWATPKPTLWPILLTPLPSPYIRNKHFPRAPVPQTPQGASKLGKLLFVLQFAPPHTQDVAGDPVKPRLKKKKKMSSGDMLFR